MTDDSVIVPEELAGWMEEAANEFRTNIARLIGRIRSNDKGLTCVNIPVIESMPEPFPAINLSRYELDSLIEALKVNTYVEKFWMRLTNVDTDATYVATFFEKLLATHPSMTDVMITAGDDKKILSDELMGVIAKAMKINRSLKKLQLFRCNIVGEEGAEKLFKGLAHNNTLEELSLDRNKITSCGSDKAVFGKISIKCLSVANNELDDVAAETIFKGLRANSTVVDLMLHGNRITDKSCLAVADMLRDNATLHFLVLSDNQITNAGALGLAAPLQHINYSLFLLALVNNPGISMSVQAYISQLCSKNARIYQTFEQMKHKESGCNSAATLPVSLQPHVLGLVESKPDLLFAQLKSNPSLYNNNKQQQQQQQQQKGALTCRNNKKRTCHNEKTPSSENKKISRSDNGSRSY